MHHDTPQYIPISALLPFDRTATMHTLACELNHRIHVLHDYALHDQLVADANLRPIYVVPAQHEHYRVVNGTPAVTILRDVLHRTTILAVILHPADPRANPLYWNHTADTPD